MRRCAFGLTRRNTFLKSSNRCKLTIYFYIIILLLLLLLDCVPESRHMRRFNKYNVM